MSFDLGHAIKPARVLAALLALSILGTPSPPSQAAEYTFHLMANDPTSGADASISPDGTMFATSSRRGGHQNIWLYDIAAARWRQLTKGDDYDSEPSWSPDGSRIAFASMRGGSKAIWTLRLADGALTQVTTERAEVDYPAWSPDGSSIVYTSGPWKARYFKIIASAGGEPRNVSKKAGHLGACKFFPDGESLICHTYENNRGNIIRLSLDGTVLDHLTHGVFDYKPAVSPDGSEVVFSRIEDGTSVIWQSPASLIRPTRFSTALTAPLGEDRWPMYTQSGRLFFHRVVNRGTAVMVYHRGSGQIETLVGSDEKPSQAAFDSAARRVAYCAELDGRSVVRILDRATGTRRTLELGGREACFPRFAPDDRTIAVTIKIDGVWQIAVVDADDGDPRVLTDRAHLRGLNGPLDWSPDGVRLVFKADTAPYESALFTVDTRTANLERVTHGPDFFEAPSWSPDGESIAFMSAHSGEWLWGLYRQTLRDSRVEALAPNDSTEKNYPRLLADGRAIWMQADGCDATEFVVERDAAGREQSLTKMPGGHWPSYSHDGDQLLFTAMLRNVEFWMGDHTEALQTPAAQDPANRRSEHDQAVDPKAQFAKSIASRERSDLLACANVHNLQKVPLSVPTDAKVADFARILHGTWVRRLTIHGVPVETNSFLYFDIPIPESGRGQALMIDRVNQGSDDLASVTGSVDTKPARQANKANFVHQIDEGRLPGAELEVPATTGAYWSVSIKPAPTDAASQDHSGVTLELAGDYRGTGDEYPPNGFHFTETGTFFRDGSAYVTLHPWRAPPQAVGQPQTTPLTNATELSSSAYSVDAVVIEGGDVDAAGNVILAGDPTFAGPNETARPTLTFVSCQDGIVDRYYKINSTTPTVEGKSLRAAWDSALASGVFQVVPAR